MTSPTLVSASAPAGRVHVLELIGNSIVGGMETYVARLIERLPRERFAVTAVLPNWCALAQQLHDAGTEVLVLPMPDEPSWSSVQAAAAYVRHAGVDVLHAHLPNAHLLAAIVGSLSGPPVLATVHGRQVHMQDLEAHRLAGTHLSLVCRYSHCHALGIGVDPRWLSCIANGVDAEKFHPAPRSGALRDRCSLPADAPLVAFVGRLSPEKGPEVFLRAVQLLGSLVPEAQAVLCGDGPQRASLEAFVAQAGLGHRVHFAGVMQDMPAVYADVDVVASTSHSEALPLSLMEAMACGLPVVATRVGGVPDLIDHGRTGWLQAPRDVEGIAHALARLLRAADERQRMGQRGRERVVAEFGIDRCVQRTGELLERLARRAPAASRSMATGAS